MWARFKALLRKLGVRLPEFVTIMDPDFGPVRFRNTFAQVQTPWAGGATVFCFYADPSVGPPMPVLETVRKLVGVSGDWDQRARAVAIRDMLSHLNDDWLTNGEAKFDGPGLDAAMSLETVWVSESGSVELYYHCGDLFGGHAIQVRGSVRKGPRSASMA